MAVKSTFVLLLGSTLLLGACGGGGISAEAEAKKSIQEIIDAKVSAISSIDPDKTNFSDLAPFGAAVGNARIVFLTESVHGSGDTMLLNTRLLKYLHQEKGFDAILIESGMFDLSRMVEMKAELGVSYLDSAPGRIFYDWSRNEEGRKMVAYLDATYASARPLQLIGIDGLQAGESAVNELQPRLEHYLNSMSSTLPQSANWPTYKKVVNLIANLSEKTPPASADLATFKQVSASLDAQLCNTPYISGEVPLKSKSYWCRMTRTILNEADYLWNSTGILDHSPRDKSQAANAKWWLDGPLKGKKVVIWTHTYHGIAESADSNRATTASEMEKYYPGQIHTSVISNSSSAKCKLCSPMETDLEFYLRNNNIYLAYPSDLATQTVLNSLYIRENGFSPTSPNHFGKFYQSLFHTQGIGVYSTDWAKYPAKAWPQKLVN